MWKSVGCVFEVAIAHKATTAGTWCIWHMGHAPHAAPVTEITEQKQINKRCGSEQVVATKAAQAESGVSKLPQGADYTGAPQMGHISSSIHISSDDGQAWLFSAGFHLDLQQLYASMMKHSLFKQVRWEVKG